jgi:V8-like Glu-specific endopeptidase
MYTFTSSMLHEDEVIAMQEAAGNSTSSIDGIRKIYYSVDAGGGSSGGPVYLTTVMNGKKYYTVIGIHVSGSSMFHSAVRMTTDLLHFYKNNDNLSW